MHVPAVSPRELTGTAALKPGIPPGARGGIQILGMVLDGPLGEPCGKWRRLSPPGRLCPQNPHIPMFVTAPVLKFPSVIVEQVQPAPVVEWDACIRGHVCTCLSRCRAAPTVFPTATLPISRLRQVPTGQTAQQTAEILQVRLLDQVVSMPFVAVQTMQFLEIPQLQFLDTDDMPVCVGQGFWSGRAENCEVPQLPFFVQQCMPVVVQRQVQVLTSMVVLPVQIPQGAVLRFTCPILCSKEASLEELA